MSGGAAGRVATRWTTAQAISRRPASGPQRLAACRRLGPGKLADLPVVASRSALPPTAEDGEYVSHGDGARRWRGAGRGGASRLAGQAAAGVSPLPLRSSRRPCRVNSSGNEGPVSTTTITNKTTSATRVECGAPALPSVTRVPGSCTGYRATPHPHTTAATPSAAMTRMPPGRPRLTRARTARPRTAASITSGSGRPVRRSYRAGLEACSSAGGASDSVPATMAPAWARRVKQDRMRWSPRRSASPARDDGGQVAARGDEQEPGQHRGRAGPGAQAGIRGIGSDASGGDRADHRTHENGLSSDEKAKAPPTARSRLGRDSSLPRANPDPRSTIPAGHTRGRADAAAHLRRQGRRPARRCLHPSAVSSSSGARGASGCGQCPIRGAGWACVPGPCPLRLELRPPRRDPDHAGPYQVQPGEQAADPGPVAQPGRNDLGLVQPQGRLGGLLGVDVAGRVRDCHEAARHAPGHQRGHHLAGLSVVGHRPGEIPRRGGRLPDRLRVAQAGIDVVVGAFGVLASSARACCERIVSSPLLYRAGVARPRSWAMRVPRSWSTLVQ